MLIYVAVYLSKAASRLLYNVADISYFGSRKSFCTDGLLNSFPFSGLHAAPQVTDYTANAALNYYLYESIFCIWC
jgi:hypothetical protein